MVKQKNIIVGFIIIVMLISAFYLSRKQFHAKLYNKTGGDIDSLIVGQTFIGHLSKNDSIQNINFRKFQFDESEPYEKICGIIQNIKLEQLYWSWCGTGRNRKLKGSYIFDIKKGKDDKGITCIYLVTHGGQIFTWQ